MKRFYISLAVLAASISGLLLLNIVNGTSNAALPRDCDSNSIIYCGATTPKELTDRYKANKTGDLKTIYRSYGLSDYEVANAGTVAKMGEVHRDGRITVNGETVATDAMSIGRQKNNGNRVKVTIGGKTYYKGKPEHSFAKNTKSIAAFVFFDKDGNFKAAIITSCGNPVEGKPKPKPVYECKSLVADKISRTERKFTVTASAKNGATIESYTYDFGDGKKETKNVTTINHTYEKPGTYTAKVTVNVKVNGQSKAVTGAKCEVPVTIEEEPVTPEYVCNSLTVDKINRTTFKFTTNYTVTHATFKSVEYAIRDDKGEEIARISGDTYTQKKPGTYSIQAYVTVMVNDEEKTVTGDDCKQPFTVTEEKEVKVCNPETGKTITVPESEKDNYKPVGDKACEPVAELPKTGPAEFIGSALGLGSLIAAIGYYAASRRGLLDELLGR